MPATDLARKTAEIANRDVGQREDLGPNDSVRIRQYMHTVRLPIGHGFPYCAAAVSTWILEAGTALNLPAYDFVFSASAVGLAQHNPDLCFDPADLEPGMIPCVGVIDHGNGKGHAFLIVGMTESPTGTDWDLLQTIEANTNHGGSRDGGGTMALNIRRIGDLYKCVAIR